MFLQPVKIKRFVDTRKVFTECPYKDDQLHHWRKLVGTENPKHDDVYHVIGVTNLKEGITDYMGREDGYAFKQFKSHKVYIVAKGIGRRYKVLPEDMELVEVGEGA